MARLKEVALSDEGVGREGFEPSRTFVQGILSPRRLPVSPPPRDSGAIVP